MNQANLDLHIDELIIDGLPHVNGDQLGAIVRQELARLFTEQGIPPGLRQSGQMAALDGGAISVPPNAPVEAVGAQIARSLYGGFSQ